MACARPPVSFQISHESTVPNASSAASARCLHAVAAVVEQPADLRAGEVGIDQQARAGPHFGFEPARAQVLADVGRTAALPDDSIVDGAPGGAVPDDRRLALVRDADRGDVVERHCSLGEYRLRALDLRRPRSPPDRGTPSRVADRSAGTRRDACATAAPAASNKIARELEVPWSSARMYLAIGGLYRGGKLRYRRRRSRDARCTNCASAHQPHQPKTCTRDQRDGDPPVVRDERDRKDDRDDGEQRACEEVDRQHLPG